MYQFFMGVLVGILAAGIALVVYLELSGQKEFDTIQAAKDMEIGDGVTLSEGLEAYFGGDTLWGSPEGDFARGLVGLNRPAATVYAHPKTGEIRFIYPAFGGVADEEQIKALLAQMVRQAKAKKTAS